MSVTAMCAGNVVVFLQRFADTHRDCFFADIQVRKSGHQSASIEFVYLFLKQTNAHHPSVHINQFLFCNRSDLWMFRDSRHFATPDIRANTSKMTAKSSFSHPMPRAAVRNSLVTAVVGTGTFNCRPSSMASNISFCIMLTSNHASSGCSSTKGPRYLIIGEATALLTKTSTATSRLMPLFSASNTPSEKASICTARLRLTAIFIASAMPLSPT